MIWAMVRLEMEREQKEEEVVVVESTAKVPVVGMTQFSAEGQQLVRVLFWSRHSRTAAAWMLMLLPVWLALR